MVKKYVRLISIISVFMLAGLFIKEGVTMEEDSTGVITLKEQVSKLSRGMTISEVEQRIGEPTHNMGFGRYIPVYVFSGGESLTLDYRPDNDTLMTARNKDGFDLLATEYTAKVAEFPIFINNKKISTSNPIVTINDRTYIPLKELEEQLGVKIEWSEDECAVKIETK